MYEPIDDHEYSDLSEQEFIDKYLLPHKPCVVRNATSNLPCQNWTLKYLLNKCGENNVVTRTETNCENYKNGTEYKSKNISFKTYIKNLEENNKYSKNSYLAVQNIKYSLPQLLPDIANQETDLPKYVQNIHHGPFLWIAPKDHYEYMHVDADEGMLMILNGEKTVKLVSYSNFHDLQPHKLGSLGRTIQSGVDVDSLVGKTIVYKTKLHSSDLLYIPAFYWHQVTTNEQTVSMNIFWGEHAQSEKNLRGFAKRVLCAGNNELFTAFSYWICNVIEQNREYTNFSRILSRIDQVVKHFLRKQWRETLEDSEVEVVVKVIKDYLELENFPAKAASDVSKVPPELKIRGLRERHTQAAPAYSINKSNEKQFH